MNKLYTLLIFASVVLSAANYSFSQCTPNPSCNDTLNPGEICPETLPDGTVGQPYNQTVTIIPPATADLGPPYGTINIVKIKITNVTGMPGGLTYVTNPANGEFVVTNPATRYCVLISGTPDSAGVYPLSITVIPYINVGGFTVPGPSQVDDTSLSITINTAGTIYMNTNKIVSINPKPNPFQNTTLLGFYSNKSSLFEFTIYDLVGNKLYFEKIQAAKGENYFEFNGSKLPKGVYFYTIQNDYDKITRKLIKQ